MPGKIFVVSMFIAFFAWLLMSCAIKTNINEAPTMVNVLFPELGFVLDESIFYGRWTASTDPQGGEITYKVRYADAIEELESQLINETKETRFLFSNLKEGTWYWQVTACDEEGNSTKSLIWNFKITKRTPPIQINATLNSSGTQIELKYDKPMEDPAGKKNCFVVKRDSKSTENIINSTKSIEIVPTNRIEMKPETDDTYLLTLEEVITFNENLTIDYIPGSIQSVDGARLEAFEGLPIINTVPRPTPVCHSATLTADGRKVQLGFDIEMRTPTAQQVNQFDLFVNDFNNDLIGAKLGEDKRVIILELRKPIGRDNTVHISYTKGTISSLYGDFLESFEKKQVNTDAQTVILVGKDIQWHYFSIQDAIDSELTVNGDIIKVATGTYTENIQFKGKAVILKSTYETNENAIALTIIDGGNNNQPTISIGTLDPVSDRNKLAQIPVIEGFTIKNGSRNSNPTADRNKMSPMGGIYIGQEAEIRFNVITENGSEITGNQGCGIYVNGCSAHIHHNLIENNYNRHGGSGIYIGKSASGSQRIYANMIRNNKSGIGSGIYIAENTTPVNADDEAWQRFNVPGASVHGVERNSNIADNNTYSGNSRTDIPMSYRALQDEGKDIFFEGFMTSLIADFELIPAKVTGIEDDETNLNISCKINHATIEGSLIIHLPPEITITTAASFTSSGTKRAVQAQEILDSGHTLFVQGITAEGPNQILIELIPDWELKMGSFRFSAQIDYDGEGTKYLKSPIYEATLTVPPLYASPSIAVVSPKDGIEFATTTVTFTWEATPGTQTNLSSAREDYGIEKTLFYLAETEQSFGEGETATNTITKTDLAYGREYKWKAKAVGNNGKTDQTTPDATFITRYILRETGNEGFTASDTFSIDTEAWDEYVVSINLNNLPARFLGKTNFTLRVNGTNYVFEESQFKPAFHFLSIPFIVITEQEEEIYKPSEEDIRNALFWCQ